VLLDALVAAFGMCGGDGFDPIAEIAMLRTVLERYLRISPADST